MNTPETAPQKAPRAHKRGGLFVTDAEIIERFNVPVEIGRQAIEWLEKDRKSGFPPKQRLWGNRRYWPAVEKWLDAANKLNLRTSQEEGR